MTTTDYHKLVDSRDSNLNGIVLRQFSNYIEKPQISSCFQVGVDYKISPCAPCNPGSYSDKEGSAECTQCPVNHFQEFKGQSSCKKCPENLHSGFGETKCTELLQCQRKDFYSKFEPIEKCQLNATSGVYYRKRSVVLEGNKSSSLSGKICRGFIQSGF